MKPAALSGDGIALYLPDGRTVAVSAEYAHALAEALPELLFDDGMSRFLDSIAPHCRCCADCCEVPCGGCQAGGICDAFRCRCETDLNGYDNDCDDWLDDGPATR